MPPRSSSAGPTAARFRHSSVRRNSAGPAARVNALVASHSQQPPGERYRPVVALRPNLHLAVFHRGQMVLLIPISVKPLFPAGNKPRRAAPGRRAGWFPSLRYQSHASMKSLDRYVILNRRYRRASQPARQPSSLLHRSFQTKRSLKCRRHPWRVE